MSGEMKENAFPSLSPPPSTHTFPPSDMADVLKGDYVSIKSLPDEEYTVVYHKGELAFCFALELVDGQKGCYKTDENKEISYGTFPKEPDAHGREPVGEQHLFHNNWLLPSIIFNSANQEPEFSQASFP
ncbi:hypothetical protein CDAR_289941 [Caerostris darwini]|uniref:Uncharacterized protein n=1 Tax=Caerostris darwini TaxID=1538125 RepID=A0AAV4WYW8_9ARAC|nr:hypothetical protein CDAR_289941 [Caerostris darwini]